MAARALLGSELFSNEVKQNIYINACGSRAFLNIIGHLVPVFLHSLTNVHTILPRGMLIVRAGIFIGFLVSLLGNALAFPIQRV